MSQEPLQNAIDALADAIPSGHLMAATDYAELLFEAARLLAESRGAAGHITHLEAEVERLEEARDGALLQDRDYLLAEVERLGKLVPNAEEDAEIVRLKEDYLRMRQKVALLEAEVERLKGVDGIPLSSIRWFSGGKT